MINEAPYCREYEKREQKKYEPILKEIKKQEEWRVEEGRKGKGEEGKRGYIKEGKGGKKEGDKNGGGEQTVIT